MFAELMGQLSQAALSQSEQHRRQKLQNGRSGVQEQIDSGLLRPEEGAELLGLIDKQLAPLMQREQESVELGRQAEELAFKDENRKMAEANAFGLAHAAKDVPNQIIELPDPDTGMVHRMYRNPNNGSLEPVFQGGEGTIHPGGMLDFGLGLSTGEYSGAGVGTGTGGVEAGVGGSADVTGQQQNANANMDVNPDGQVSAPPELVNRLINEIINNAPNDPDTGLRTQYSEDQLADLLQVRMNLMQRFSSPSRPPSDLERREQELQNRYRELQIRRMEQQLQNAAEANGFDVIYTASGMAYVPKGTPLPNSTTGGQGRPTSPQQSGGQQGQQQTPQSQQPQTVQRLTQEQREAMAQVPVWDRQIWHGNYNEQWYNNTRSIWQRGNDLDYPQLSYLAERSADLMSLHGSFESMPPGIQEEYRQINDQIRVIMRELNNSASAPTPRAPEVAQPNEPSSWIENSWPDPGHIARHSGGLVGLAGWAEPWYRMLTGQ